MTDKYVKELPSAINLPVENLNRVFKNTTNSYKFLWFLAILEVAKEGEVNYIQENKIHLDEIFNKMIRFAWYPVAHCKLSFGIQDKIGSDIGEFINDYKNGEHKKKAVLESYLKIKGKARRRELKKYVPYRFLSPWFSNETGGLKDSKVNAKIMQLTHSYYEITYRQPLYKINMDEFYIEVQPEWREYLEKFHTILSDFCLWNFQNYLQKKNPNCLNISEKIVEPEKRDLNRAKDFWQLYASGNELKSLYSGNSLGNSGYAIDHFLPWSFVAHDQIWNTIPAENDVNSSKSDRLPDFKLYFSNYSSLHAEAIKVAFIEKKLKLIEDYNILFKVNTEDLLLLCKNELKFKEKFENELQPLHDIARNMGFQPGWVYEAS